MDIARVQTESLPSNTLPPEMAERKLKRPTSSPWTSFGFDRETRSAWRGMGRGENMMKDFTRNIDATGDDDACIVASFGGGMKRDIPEVTVREFKELEESARSTRGQVEIENRDRRTVNNWFNANGCRVTRNRDKRGLLWCVTSPAGRMVQYSINAFGNDDGVKGRHSLGYKLACTLTLAASRGATKRTLVKMRDERLSLKERVRKRPASAV